jgi:hypothetical protein
VEIIDNWALAVSCYDPDHTLVEKLQTISTKFRKQQETGELPVNFMRDHYDVYCLLQRPEVQAFVGTAPYKAYKAKRFRQSDNSNIAKNQAFILTEPKTRATYAKAFAETSALYYQEKPTFEQILTKFLAWAGRL